MTSTEAASLSLRGLRVLIVEDEAFVAMALEEGFEKAGAEVVGPAATLAEATEYAEAEKIDAAVLDIDLAGLDVFPAADILRRRGVPFVFQTGHGQRRELAADYPEVKVCKKPVSPKALVEVVHELLPAS
ncbi:response regulator [Parvularcula maris]|uniref:Response regulator n=1 Tax=Parvularcula maris TaxID=2965077 RepID=A0A9X2LA93_9PROT|nr:response regulator [Parvularcula maris]MCQ8186005.1 response regulator [Parvularcula maris]